MLKEDVIMQVFSIMGMHQFLESCAWDLNKRMRRDIHPRRCLSLKPRCTRSTIARALSLKNIVVIKLQGNFRSKLISLPTTLRELSVTGVCGEFKGCIVAPHVCHLKVLSLNSMFSTCTRDILGAVGEGLTDLHISGTYTSAAAGAVPYPWPHTLRTLTLTYACISCSLPATITTLRVYDSDICAVVIPVSVKELVIANKYCEEMMRDFRVDDSHLLPESDVRTVLHEGLEVLRIRDRFFNEPLDELPSTLMTLEIGVKGAEHQWFNHSLLHLPPALQLLQIHNPAFTGQIGPVPPKCTVGCSQ